MYLVYIFACIFACIFAVSRVSADGVLCLIDAWGEYYAYFCCVYFVCYVLSQYQVPHVLWVRFVMVGMECQVCAYCYGIVTHALVAKLLLGER